MCLRSAWYCLAWSLLCSTLSLPGLSYLPRHFLHIPSFVFTSPSVLKSVPAPLSFPADVLSKQGELGEVKSSVSMQCCFYLEHRQVVRYWGYTMWCSVLSVGHFGSLEDCVFWKRVQLSDAYVGGWGFLSDPSIILTEQLLTLVNLNQFLFFFVFMSNCFR